MSVMSVSNPMREANGFKLGVFAYTYEGGNAITTVPERWPARWPEIAQMIKVADELGLDFLLPAARWKGIPGAVNNRLWSFETLTHAASAAAITRRIGVFATVHTPIIHPIVAAKCMATIDHVSGGRSGINIVCGWNQADFDMFGLEVLPHAERYVQGAEWLDIWSRPDGRSAGTVRLRRQTLSEPQSRFGLAGIAADTATGRVLRCLFAGRKGFCGSACGFLADRS